LGHPNASPRRWEPSREYRVNLRAKAGPFVDRPSFEPADATAFVPATESGVVASWTLDDGALHVAAAPHAGGVQLARFGDASGWDQVQVRTTVDPEGFRAGVAVAVSGTPVAQAIYALVDESSGAARIVVAERRDSATIEVAAAALPPDTPRPYVLECVAFDDRVRASVGDVVVEQPRERGDLRGGRLALVADGGGRFTSLAVIALDAWRCYFRTSRYDDFVAHIGSFDGAVDALEAGAAGAATGSVADLLARDSDAITSTMTPAADSEARERLFGGWLDALALPLREAPRALTITRRLEGASTDVLVIESPEPLAFSRDVSLGVRRRLHTPPLPPHGTPVDFAAFIANLEFSAHALVVPARPPTLAALRAVVRGVRTARGIAYEVYALPVRKSGALRLTRPRSLSSDAAPAAFATIGPDEVGLVDAGQRLLKPPFPVPPIPTYVIVPVRLLSNGDERRAFVIPVGMSPGTHVPFAAGTYELAFAIDRARWRSATPDATTNYRASVTVSIKL
jgi:hypothetical protein